MPGQEGGNTIASVLNGEVNPSGHLPSTISREYSLEPTAENFPQAFADKPERELKGFAKTPELAPGESCTVSIHVTKESLASYDESKSAWVIDSGKYTFVAAQDAMDNSLKKTVKVE